MKSERLKNTEKNPDKTPRNVENCFITLAFQNISFLHI